jgi:hypothetical protein
VVAAVLTYAFQVELQEQAAAAESEEQAQRTTSAPQEQSTPGPVVVVAGCKSRVGLFFTLAVRVVRV